MKLTKSFFLAYLDAPLHMWLKAKNEVQPKPLSLYDRHLMDQGYIVEKLAKKFLEKIVVRNYPLGTKISFEETLADGNYESRIDALVHNTENDTYDLYEIKSSTNVHTEHKYDVTFQYLVGKATLKINKVYLVHSNSEYVKNGELDLNGFFVIDDMAEEIAKKEDEVFQLRLEAWNTLRLSNAPLDEHCFNPKTCPYLAICFPDLPEYPIYDLNRGSKRQYQELINLGITQVYDISSNFTQNYKQRLQLKSAHSRKPVIDHNAVKHELNSLKFPLYFLDYETYAEAVPMYDGYKPYQQITTQYSIHVARHPKSKDFEHYEFLATKPGDPSPELVAQLCSVIGDCGNVIVWNKAFECGRNEELTELCPQYADQLRNINERTFDLMEIFSHGLYVDYRFHGSASIKNVLPVLVPELSYKELEIGEGTAAMMQWHEMVYGGLSQSEQDKIAKNLLTYCKLDTWAMVEIWEKLNSIQ